jgi:hypothetical protein
VVIRNYRSWCTFIDHMCRTKRSICLMAAFASVAVTSAAHAVERLGTPIPIGRSGENTFAAVSGAGHLPAFVTSDDRGHDVVVHEDRTGRWRTFSIGTPLAARTALLEDGRELVAYDTDARAPERTGSVLVQTWGSDGRVTPSQPALSTIDPLFEGDSDSAEWEMQTSRDGTIVIVAPGAVDGVHDGGIYATTREPGRAFSAQQQVFAPPHPDPTFGVDDQPQITLSRIAADGSASIRAVSQGPADQLVAGRVGRGAFVDGATATPPAPVRTLPDGEPTDDPLSQDGRLKLPPGVHTVATYADASTPIRVGPAITALCRAASGGCAVPQLLIWGNGARRLVIRTEACDDCSFPTDDRAYVAQADATGVFDAPALATRHGIEAAVAGSEPGVVDFVRGQLAADTGNTVLIDFAPGPRPLSLVPFGDVSLPARPRVTLDPIAGTDGGRLTMRLDCVTTCRIGATVHNGRRVAHASVAVATLGPPRRTLEPLEPALLSFPSSITNPIRPLRLVVTATGPGGRSTRLIRTLDPGARRGNTARYWCLAGQTSARCRR